MKYSPISLFVYKRPEHTRRAIESLMQCPEFYDSPVYVFCDGIKKEEDRDKVVQTRELVHSLLNGKAKIIEHPKNQGLANSIISGVNQLCEIYGRVIVIEDDLVVAPEFLKFLNTALEKYKDEDLVMQVSGYMFPVPELRNENEALFLPFIYSWGWGTWQRAWNKFDPQSIGWEVLKTDINMRLRFNLDNNYGFFEMLNCQMSGEIDSWAVRWYWSVFKHNGYILYPPISYVTNIGLDGTGTHGSWYANQCLKQIYQHKNLNYISLPSEIIVKPDKFNLVKSYMRTLQPKWLKWIKKIVNPSFISLIRNYVLTIHNYLK
ncbi:hypothetical protein [Nostoc sp.]|uniref:hypothetical protein n=1 Tax=Nostoc sp. TaxID=1180 RepID=UPI002FFB22B9